MTLNPDGSCTVRDDGRGIPTGIKNDDDHDPKRSAAEIVFTELHAGGKFDQNSYKVSGGLHGVGVSVVNALSTWLRARIWREGKEHFIEFNDGVAVAPLKVVGDANGNRGTEVTFFPSPQTFTMVEFDYATLEHRLRELAFLNSGVQSVVITDNRGTLNVNVVELFMYEGGISRPLCAISTGPSRRSSRNPFLSRASAMASRRCRSVRCGGMTVITRACFCFTNNIPQRDGGTHLGGLPRGA